MKSDTVILRQDVGYRLRVGGGKRSKITRLSRQSLRRMKLHFRNMPDPAYMITLTYPSVWQNDGYEVKRHFTAIKKWLIRHGVTGGAWFLEFQKRGAPHFHIFVNNSVLPEDLAAAWVRVLHPWITRLDSREAAEGLQKAYHWHVGGVLVGKSKDGRVCTNRSCIEPVRVKHAAAAYATSYAAKAEQKKVPESYRNVGRFWGAWGDYGKVDNSAYGDRLENPFNVTETELEDSKVIIRTIRSLRGILKSRGFEPKDNGIYGFVAWGINQSTIDRLISFYSTSSKSVHTGFECTS